MLQVNIATVDKAYLEYEQEQAKIDGHVLYCEYCNLPMGIEDNAKVHFNEEFEEKGFIKLLNVQLVERVLTLAFYHETCWYRKLSVFKKVGIEVAEFDFMYVLELAEYVASMNRERDCR